MNSPMSAFEEPEVALIEAFATVEDVVETMTVRAETGRQDSYDLALNRLRDDVLQRFSAAELQAQGEMTIAWCRERAAQVVSDVNAESLAKAQHPAFDDYAQTIDHLLDDLLGLGPLERLLEIDGVEDIALNGPDDIWYKARGEWVKTPIRFRNAEHLQFLLNQAIVHSGRMLSPQTPIVDARLRSGHRINLVTTPIADPWPSAVIRVHRPGALSIVDLLERGDEGLAQLEPLPISDYGEYDSGHGMITAVAVTFLDMAVKSGFNILNVGPTGSAKTTLINILGRMLPENARIVVIEDTPEIVLGRGNFQRLVTRPASLEGLREISQRDLVKVALRQRPDALTVGEARGAEVFDLLKALRTGHRNGLTSIHAHSVEDVYERITMMLQEGDFQTEVSERMVARWVAKAFTLAITLRVKGKRRRVQEIVEFTGGTEGPMPVTKPLFVYDDQARRLTCTGYALDPLHEEQLNEHGYSYRSILEMAMARSECAGY
jgi:pilus assembly protein CpaF